MPTAEEQVKAQQRDARNRAARAEAIGLLIIVGIILLLVVLRWGGHIAWSAR